MIRIVGTPGIPLEQLDYREDTFKPLHVKQTITIELVVGDSERTTHVSSLLSSTKQDRMHDLLQSNRDVFA